LDEQNRVYGVMRDPLVKGGVGSALEILPKVVDRG